MLVITQSRKTVKTLTLYKQRKKNPICITKQLTCYQLLGYTSNKTEFFLQTKRMNQFLSKSDPNSECISHREHFSSLLIRDGFNSGVIAKNCYQQRHLDTVYIGSGRDVFHLELIRECFHAGRMFPRGQNVPTRDRRTFSPGMFLRQIRDAVPIQQYSHYFW